MPFSIAEIYDKVCQKYQGNKRLDHILGVANTARNLAIIYGENPDKAYVAGLLHDYIKYESVEEMINIIDDKVVENRFKDSPQIYHAYASAKACQTVFGIDDDEIINAIRYHVYGRVSMSMLEKILVIADFTETTRHYEDCIEVRHMLEKGDFDKAMYYCIYYTNQAVIRHGNIPMDDQIEILNYLKEKYYGNVKND